MLNQIVLLFPCMLHAFLGIRAVPTVMSVGLILDVILHGMLGNILLYVTILASDPVILLIVFILFSMGNVRCFVFAAGTGCPVFVIIVLRFHVMSDEIHKSAAQAAFLPVIVRIMGLILQHMILHFIQRTTRTGHTVLTGRGIIRVLIIVIQGINIRRGAYRAGSA